MPRGFLLFVFCFCVLVLLAWGVLAATHGNRHIETEITIARPPEEVWLVLTQTNDYPVWNPLILRLAGTLGVDEKIEVTVRPPGRDEMTFDARIRVATANRELAWLGGAPVPGLFSGEHRFLLEPLGDGTTRLKHSEKFAGILVGPFTAGMLDDTARGFEEMNRALKARCEKRP